MKASAAFETRAWRTDAEGRCYKDRPDKGGEYKTATGKNRHGGHLQPDFSSIAR
jgi:hypothetical protein